MFRAASDLRPGTRPHYRRTKLRNVLRQLSAGETDLESLPPDLWATSHREHALGHRLHESRRQPEQRQARRAVAG
jgi:hypothetical protein